MSDNPAAEKFSKLLEKKKLGISCAPEDWINTALDMPKLRLVPLSPVLSYRSTVLPQPFHNDPADQIIMATAREENATILTKDEKIHDDYRISYLKDHIKACALAIEDGVEMLGYSPWSLIDLLSSHQGFKKRYGLIYIDREDHDEKELKRIRKDSFFWYHIDSARHVTEAFRHRSSTRSPLAHGRTS